MGERLPVEAGCVRECVTRMCAFRSEAEVRISAVWELEAPVDSCHVKVSKCKADVCGGPGRGARIYLGPESACDLRFIAFSRFIPFTMMGDLSYLKI